MMLNRASYVAGSLSRLKERQVLHEQIRTAFFNQYQHGPHKANNPDVTYSRILKDLFSKEGREEAKKELKLMLKRPLMFNFRQKIEIVRDETEIFEDFDSNESINRWKPVADSDSFNGFSTANFDRSPSGHGWFHGVIDNTVPDDGMTENSGFAAIIGPHAPRDSLFKVELLWDWQRYNCLEIKYRGDGRRYFVVINTADAFNDLSWYDNYSYPIYTRGGPYWQTCRIPFSKFIYNYRSFTQDRQGTFPPWKVKFVSIALHDKIDGPFSLEIDYMGLRYQSVSFSEDTPYESYRFAHVKNRPLQVECEAPERD